MMPEIHVRSSVGRLELRALRKAYGGFLAVKDLSLSINKGEFVTLLGQSGSGKTTTLMMIAGFVEPDSGMIELDGRDLVGIPTHLRSIGVVFQSYALFPHMTVKENIGFPLRMRDLPENEVHRRVRAMLDLVHLKELGDRIPTQLSGGQQQRVALARALVFNPPVLLLDEPLGALDRLLREEMKLELRRVHQELGTTMVYVTHDQDEALVLSDKIAVMRSGELEQVGTPDEVYRSPKNSFVARFVGESNFLDGQVSESIGRTTQVAIGDCHVAGIHARPLRVGESARVFVRPEKILLEGPGTSASALRGTVADKLYGGELIRFHVQTPTDRVVVKQPNRHGSFLPAVGESVLLSWSVDDAIVFPEEDRAI